MADITWNGPSSFAYAPPHKALSKPPHVVLPKRLGSGADFMYWRKKNPRLLKWIDNHASDPNYRPTRSTAWPEALEEWNNVVDQLVSDGMLVHEDDGMTWLYENNPEFKGQADRLFEADAKFTNELCKKQLFWKLNRAAWTALWSVRIAKKSGGDPHKKQR